MENRALQQAGRSKKEILFRPRVNELVKQAAEHTLVTVTAGTGYGKSQAVTAFLDYPDITHVWLHLTELDNYPARFWDMFAKAMYSHSPALSRQMTNMGFPDTMEKTYQFLMGFTKGAYQLGRFVLVLDDFHKIEERAIISFVETLCFAEMENLTIFLLTRHPLMIDYSGLQKGGLHANISVADLRFTPEETRAYYEQIHLSFPEDVLHNIQASTEGWPLAIYLIGLHRQKRGRLFDDPIECTVPLLYSLIEMEIFSEYTEDQQRAFASMAVMESIPLNLMKVLSGHLYADMVDLMRQNMFVQYNPQIEQYHFHPIFRLFLQQKQSAFTPEEMNHLYLAVGDWHADNHKYIEALTFYKQCKNHNKVWQIIRKHGVEAGMPAFSLSLLDELPPEYIEANPVTRVMRAFLLIHTGEIELAYQSYLDIKDEFESLTQTPERTIVLGEAYLGLAFTSIMRSSYDFIAYYRRAYECLPDGSSILNASLSYLGNNSALSMFSNQPGEIDRMVQAYFDVMPYATQAMNGCGYGIEYMAASEGAFYQGKLQQAAEFAHQAIYHAQQKNQHDIVYGGFAMLGRIAFAGGDYDGSIEYLNQLRQYADGIEKPYMFGMEDIAEAWFYSHVDRIDKVERWIAGGIKPSNGAMVLLMGREKVVQGYCLYRQGEYYELLALLDHMEEQYNKRNLRFLIMQVYLLRALCTFRLGDDATTLKHLLHLYDLCRQNDLTMYFIEFGEDMCQLLDAMWDELARCEGVEEAWFIGIRAKAEVFGKNQRHISEEFKRRNLRQNNGIAPLAPQEQEILQGLAQGLGREEIATRYNLALNGVKSGIKSLLSKLGAINRADALRIAEEHELL